MDVKTAIRHGDAEALRVLLSEDASRANALLRTVRPLGVGTVTHAAPAGDRWHAQLRLLGPPGRSRELLSKVLPDCWSRNPKRRHRFELEAQATPAGTLTRMEVRGSVKKSGLSRVPNPGIVGNEA